MAEKMNETMKKLNMSLDDIIKENRDDKKGKKPIFNSSTANRVAVNKRTSKAKRDALISKRRGIKSDIKPTTNEIADEIKRQKNRLIKENGSHITEKIKMMRPKKNLKRKIWRKVEREETNANPIVKNKGKNKSKNAEIKNVNKKIRDPEGFQMGPSLAEQMGFQNAFRTNQFQIPANQSLFPMNPNQFINKRGMIQRVPLQQQPFYITPSKGNFQSQKSKNKAKTPTKQKNNPINAQQNSIRNNVPQNEMYYMVNNIPQSNNESQQKKKKRKGKNKQNPNQNNVNRLNAQQQMVGMYPIAGNSQMIYPIHMVPQQEPNRGGYPVQVPNAGYNLGFVTKKNMGKMRP